MLVPAAGGLAAPAKTSGPTIKFAKKEKVHTSTSKVTQKIKCLATGKKKCTGTLTTYMFGQTASKNHFSIKPGKWTKITLKLTSAGKADVAILIANPQGYGKCKVKAKAKQGKSKSQTTTGEVGYKLVS